MTEDQTRHCNKPVNIFEISEVFHCPNCGKSLIEYTGRILGLRITCPGCDRVIAGGEGEWPPKKNRSIKSKGSLFK